MWVFTILSVSYDASCMAVVCLFWTKHVEDYGAKRNLLGPAARSRPEIWASINVMAFLHGHCKLSHP